MVANRNIHFMVVTGEYFEISFLKIVRYSANDKAAERIIKSPVILPLPWPFVLFIIRINAPEAPTSTPMAFSQVMGSLMISAASSMVMMGNMLVTSEASMGEVIDNPVMYGT